MSFCCSFLAGFLILRSVERTVNLGDLSASCCF
ncbi:Uncharacterised protein [Vibrio cholerae]|nr:Uncharacterised protein [Vibrio cholerae]